MNPLSPCLLAIAIAFLFSSEIVLAQENSRGVVVTKGADTVIKELYDKSYAVVVGINQYPKGGSTYRHLQYARADAERVSKKLTEMGFIVHTLLDQEATRRNIIEVLGDDIGKRTEENDRIIFYFAGHGATIEKADRKSFMGYILPHDYDPDRHKSTAISMQQLRDISSEIKAKHMLYVMDSCFSGGILTGRGSAPTSQTTGYRYLKNLTQNRAHVVITAGGKDQTVNEEGGSGIFTRTFLDALSKQNSTGYLTAMDLASYIMKHVPDLAPNQTPQYGHIDGEGDVVLALFKSLDYSETKGEHPAGASPDLEERLRKIEQEREEDRKKLEQERRVNRESLEKEREAARLEKERLAEERRRAAEEARLRDLEREADARRMMRERDAARMEMERAAAERRRAEEALKKRKSTELEDVFVPPTF